MHGITFCGSCGAQMPSQMPYGNNPAGNYGAQPYGGPSNGGGGGMIPPKNYMTEAILVTVITTCCCGSFISLILGIIAIVKASDVNSAFAAGNYNGAVDNANSAKTLTIWAAGIAVAWLLIWIILVVAQVGVVLSLLAALFPFYF